MTNYEKLTDMTIKELARYLSDFINCKYCPVSDKCHDFCVNELEKWLESEVKMNRFLFRA